MEDTDTKITVSSINEINSFNMERTITIVGAIENVSKAESEVSARLRLAYESDIQSIQPQTVMFPGLHPAAMMSTAGIVQQPQQTLAYNLQQQPQKSQMNGGNHRYYQQQQHQQQQQQQLMQPETVFLYVPNGSVGAIIGTKGTHIRNIIKFSGANVKIAQADEQQQPQDEPQQQQQPQHDRKVTIVGGPEAQWKAQYLIFEKLREEGFARGSGNGSGNAAEEIRLVVEILVPSSQVGRIIGKGGQNVRELQRVTGAVIKLPEQGSNPPGQEETPVHIIGAFFSVQSAQRRLRSMIFSHYQHQQQHQQQLSGAAREGEQQQQQTEQHVPETAEAETENNGQEAATTEA